MHPRFFALPKSRQMQIVNAAMEVFSQGDYRHCVTDDIAARAGISKGLLFHYFENKLGLYLYLYRYALDLVSERLRAPAITQERDFFKLLERAALEKLALMGEHPALFAFFFQSRVEKDETVLRALGTVWDPLIDQSAGQILAQTDWSRFRDDVDPKLVLDLVLWSAEGFSKLHGELRTGDLEELSREYLRALDLMRRHFYKPEWLELRQKEQ
ncbi:TetR/AcrR family transcriptional regulator [bacterium 210820-DFI.6.52]|nr:TetR/AcrR family transcriptional regulator [bacterium 210820-DFI.6.52]